MVNDVTVDSHARSRMVVWVDVECLILRFGWLAGIGGGVVLAAAVSVLASRPLLMLTGYPWGHLVRGLAWNWSCLGECAYGG